MLCIDWKNFLLLLCIAEGQWGITPLKKRELELAYCLMFWKVRG
jgi:hypothetical protein